MVLYSRFEKDIMEQAANIGIITEKETPTFELPPPPDILEAQEAYETHEVQEAHEIPEETEEDEEKSENFAEAYSDSQPTESSSQVSIHGIAKMFLENPKLAARLGHLLLEAGYPDETVYILQNGISLDSAPVSVLVDLAYGRFYSKNFETALSELDAALGKYPDNVDLLTAKAAISGQHPDTSQRSKAEVMFKSILKKNSESAEANYQYGRYIMQKGDFKKSQEHLEKAVKVEPYNSRYIARLGMAEFYLKHDANAETLYKKALKLNPYDHNTWFNLGELYLSEANESSYIPEVRKKTQNALEAYLKTIEHDSLHAKAHYRIGIILNANGGHKEAIRHLTNALEKMPENTSVMLQLGSAYMQLGDTAKYISYLTEVLRIDPFDRIASNEFKRLH